MEKSALQAGPLVTPRSSLVSARQRVTISPALAKELAASIGDTLALFTATERADVEYRVVEPAKTKRMQPSRAAVTRKPFVVPKHPQDTYKGDINAYCVEVPSDIHRLTQNANMAKSRPLPTAAQVIGVLPSPYVNEIVLKFSQVTTMDLPVPYPFLSLASAVAKEKKVEDVRIRLHGAPPFPESALHEHLGTLYGKEALQWKEDSHERGLRRPLYETIDGLPDDGVFVTSAVADALGVTVGDFIDIQSTISHDAYAYKKEIQQLKRKLQREAELRDSA